jgi:hypothetical protein
MNYLLQAFQNKKVTILAQNEVTAIGIVAYIRGADDNFLYLASSENIAVADLCLNIDSVFTIKVYEEGDEQELSGEETDFPNNSGQNGSSGLQ